jgi:hypothetical protein
MWHQMRAMWHQSFLLITPIVSEIYLGHCSKCKRTITPKLGRNELRFFCTALLLNKIYLLIKIFLDNSCSFRVMSRTRKGDGGTPGQTWRRLYALPLGSIKMTLKYQENTQSTTRKSCLIFSPLLYLTRFRLSSHRLYIENYSFIIHIFTAQSFTELFCLTKQTLFSLFKTKNR